MESIANHTLDGDLVLLYGSKLNLGGTDTLIVRMANEAVAVGIKVFINSDPSELRKILDDRVQYVPNTCHRDFFERIKPSSTRPLHILVFDPHIALKFLSNASQVLKELEARITLGVFHPRELFPDTQGRAMHWAMRQLLAYLGKEHWVFMNEACRASHAKHLRLDLSKYKVIPILVGNKTEPLWTPSRSRSLSVISVGRITPFKAYNWGAVEIVDELTKDGFDLTWTIFGDGPDRHKLIEECERRGLRDRVRFSGLLPYNCFQSTVCKYDLFIGMGTALLESARVGIPSVIAIDKDPLHTYGYLSEGPGDSIGEIVPEVPRVRIADIIKLYGTESNQRRLAIGRHCRERSIELSSQALRLQEIFRGVKSWKAYQNPVPYLLSAAFNGHRNLRSFLRFIRRRPPVDEY